MGVVDVAMGVDEVEVVVVVVEFVLVVVVENVVAVVVERWML